MVKDAANCPGYMLARAGHVSYVSLVRVTLGDEREEGAGAAPARLLDLALALNAQPRVLRVHFTAAGEGTRVEYFGHDELVRELKTTEHWRRALLGRRTSRDYLRLVGGRISRLDLTVRRQLPGPWPESPPGDPEIDKLLREMFKEEDDPPRQDYPGSVTISLQVDTLPPRLSRAHISMRALLASAAESDEHFIITCSCGYPECAGICRGIETVHEDGLVVWRARTLRPRRVVVFEREAYRREVLSKVREALAAHQAMGTNPIMGAGDDWARLSKQLNRLEELENRL